MKNISFLIFPILFTTFSYSQKTVENYLLKNIGYISIPSSIEIQSGNYKKFAEKYQEEYGKKFGYEISDNRIVFQQKGLNNLDKSSFTSYARVILETTIGSFGDYEKLTTKLTATASELADLNSQFKSQIEQSFRGTGLKLISWYGVSIATVNGRTALKISYLRQLNDNPYVTVSMYQFHNNDRMHQLTLSYRQQDADTWKTSYANILSSFKITNIR
jgi:hypothetical protein